MTTQEIDEALSPFPKVEAPHRLVKFFSPAGLTLLTHGTLKITPPNDFNDPFEFLPATPETPSNYDLRCWFLHPDSFLRAYYQNKHGVSYERWVEECPLKHPDRWPQSLNSITQGYAKAVSNSYGVTCFMDKRLDDLKKPETVHFWDRYAGNHTGFAVGFDPRVGLLKTIHESKFIFPVTYGDVRFKITPEQPTTNDNVLLRFFREIASHKASDWRTECEWRLVAAFNSKPTQNLVTHQIAGERIIHLLNLWRDREDAGQEIREIYFGYRASEDLKKTVLRLCRDIRLNHVSVFQTEPCAHSYAFTYRKLN